jgi:predicted permease
MKTLWQSAKGLLRNPGFTLCAALSLALGIGANVTVFSVVNLLLFRPLPVKDADRLVAICSKRANSKSVRGVSFANYQDYKQRTEMVPDMIAAMPLTVNFSDGEAPDRLRLELVSGNYFSMLGVNVVLGRAFAENEGNPEDPHAIAVIAHNTWTTRFSSDRSVIGRVVKLNGFPVTIVGVLGEEFAGERPLMPVDLFVPVSIAASLMPDGASLLRDRAQDRFRLIGRLAPGATAQQAQARMNAIAAQIAAGGDPALRGVSVVVVPETRSRPDPEAGALLPAVATIFLTVVGLVLVIACANVMTLLLARTIARSPEFALRVSLGASRQAVMKLVLFDALLVSAIGVLLAMVFARWAVSLIAAMRIDAGMPVRIPATIDWRVLAFTAGLGLLAALACSILPAIQASSSSLGNALKQESRATSSGRGIRRVRVALLVAQVAVSLTVLITGALFFRSLRNTHAIDLGYRTDDVYLFSTDLASQRYSSARSRQFYDELLARVRALPGVRSAALSYFIPLAMRKESVNVLIEGEQQTATGQQSGVDIHCNIVGLQYFQTAGTAIQRGRDFSVQDGPGSPSVAVISNTMARRFWPGQDPIGKRFRTGKEWTSVVGVAADTRFDWLFGAHLPYIYFPMSQRQMDAATLYVYAPGMAGTPGAVRNVIHSLDADLPVFGVESMSSHIDYGPSMVPVRVAALFMVSFGGIGVLLVAFGVYAVISHLVARRAAEMGIRMALGADRSSILKIILGQSLSQALIGITIGLAGSFALGKLFSSLLFGVSATDPVIWLACCVLMILAVVAAAYMPADRLAKMHPMLALRRE